MTNIALIGVPTYAGAAQRGCQMGPEAYRTAALAETLSALGHVVEDRGDIRPGDAGGIPHSNKVVKNLGETVAWTRAIRDAGLSEAGFPVFLGGDHCLAAGSISAMAERAAREARPLFVLWLDAHPDLHTPATTTSGNLHGAPMAYVTGAEGFDDYPPLAARVEPENVMMMGLRSVDPAENARIAANGFEVRDMRSIDEHGVAAPLRAFLERVKAANGRLHVSLDVDFLEPGIAPAVGTTVPGGATFREAHLIMEMVHDSGLASSLDLVELNPFLDERGRTAKLMVDLAASLMGRKVLDRMTRSY
ncbi:arginase [Pikeienuella piscinae]|uniref:Arginase n=1 Tax=Pikeienuella piscinae TaxID=2748098 RepID=A0A7M3T553_9RHOB|nr:arginase [Pikeienuella piscinae]QIE57134.1 arginase [Pikeienuella piscinae]